MIVCHDDRSFERADKVLEIEQGKLVELDSQQQSTTIKYLDIKQMKK
ncbi:MAG: hypothetical protein GXP08_07495 [Gammaproteobacteria bacterium]|nr:hypothetical protein [Gammaproteobacteria bacterium]